MKLASLKRGRDGRLVVVSRDLSRLADASAVAPTLQAALDDWDAAEPRLTELADALEAGHIARVPFDPSKCAAPLPRAFQWADGSAYVNHVELVRKARGAGGGPRRGRRRDPPAHPGQRRIAAQSGGAGARQGVRVFPLQAIIRTGAGRGDARRARPRLRRR